MSEPGRYLDAYNDMDEDWRLAFRELLFRQAEEMTELSARHGRERLKLLVSWRRQKGE